MRIEQPWTRRRRFLAPILTGLAVAAGIAVYAPVPAMATSSPASAFAGDDGGRDQTRSRGQARPRGSSSSGSARSSSASSGSRQARPRSSSTASRGSRASSAPRSAAGSGRAAVSRPGNRSGDRTVISNRRSRAPRFHRGHHGHRFHFYNPFFPHLSWYAHGFGLYSGWPYYYGYGTYPYGYGPGYRSRAPRYGSEAAADMGAIDLNVKPKDAEVFIDGFSVGRVGLYDGYPGYLWLEEGTYDLVVYQEGFQTLYREVRIFPGNVIELRERMESGLALSPEEVTPARPVAEAAAAELDPDEPGRLHFAITPADASVYMDGRFLGTARDLSSLHAGLMVTAGSHRVSVVRPAYEAEELEVEVGAGGDADVAVSLEASDG